MKAEQHTPAEKKRILIDQLWLTYYNDTLLSKGIIDADKHRRMLARIKTVT